MTNQKIQFGQWLKEKRTACQMSQRELAAELGVHYTYISKIENGNIATMPSHDLYVKLSYVLDASLDDIYDHAGYYDKSLVDSNVAIDPTLARVLRKLYEPQG